MSTELMVRVATTGWWQHALIVAGVADVARVVPLFDMAALHAAAGELDSVRVLVTYTGAMPVTREVIDALPALELVVVMGAGVDCVDVAHAADRGVAVRNCPGANTQDVAELAFGLLLAATRGIVSTDASMRAGRWENVTRHRVSGSPIGIIGMGNIGRAIARMATAAAMPVFYTSRSKADDLPYAFVPDVGDLADSVRHLVVAAPATAATRHIVDRAVIERLGPSGVLVNISRGTLVDEEALTACLADGRLGAAGLDVFATEPAVPEHLIGLPNCVLSSHNAANTHEAFATVLAKALDIVRRHLGTPAPDQRPTT